MTDQEVEQIVRGAAKSFSINWGTTAAFAVGEIFFKRIGFARIPVVVVEVFCPSGCLGPVTPVVRQVAYRELESMGLSSDILELRPTVQSDSRQSMFIDTNEASPTKGKRKRGYRREWHFEIKKPFCDTLFKWDWTGKGELKPKEQPNG